MATSLTDSSRRYTALVAHKADDEPWQIVAVIDNEALAYTEQPHTSVGAIVEEVMRRQAEAREVAGRQALADGYTDLWWVVGPTQEALQKVTTWTTATPGIPFPEGSES